MFNLIVGELAHWADKAVETAAAQMTIE